MEDELSGPELSTALDQAFERLLRRRLMAPFNRLSEDADERLAILLEEMGEALQVIGKIQRHGYASRDPTKPGDEKLNPSNRTLLEKELGDVTAAIMLMTEAGDVCEGHIEERVPEKLASLTKYTHHQGDLPARVAKTLRMV